MGKKDGKSFILRRLGKKFAKTAIRERLWNRKVWLRSQTFKAFYDSSLL
jgi:hypothetical protein